MIDTSFLENPDAIITQEMKTYIGYFVTNTTEKIFRRIAKLGISQSIANDIYAVIYNNAAGDMPLVRFYYTNIARFIELGVGRSYMSDMDLKGEGIKVENTKTPPIPSKEYDPITQTIMGTTNKGIDVSKPGKGRAGDSVDRRQYHKARPFFLNTIRMEVRRIAERMAVQMAYTNTLYISKGLSTTTITEEVDQQWQRNLALLEKLRVDLRAGHVPALE